MGTTVSKRSGRAAARIGLAALFVLVGGNARAQNYSVLPLVPDRVFITRGVSIRQGDWLAIEPSFLFVPASMGQKSPLVVVARPMLGLGGSGVGIGLAPNLAEGLELLPVSLEARIERMYGPTSWRNATYLGPHLSLSALLLKASVGWMVDVDDRSNHHIQLAIGAGF